MKHEGYDDTNCTWCIWDGYKMFRRKAGRVRHQRKTRELSNYNFLDISQNTKKSPGELS